MECAPGERLSLPPQLATAPPALAHATAALPRVDLWCLDNSLGTFAAATVQLPAPERGYDLRSPLGVTPAALLAMGAAAEVEAWTVPKAPQGDVPAAERQQDVQQPAAAASKGQPQGQPSLRKQQGPVEMFQRFQNSRQEMRTDMVARIVTPSGARAASGSVGACRSFGAGAAMHGSMRA